MFGVVMRHTARASKDSIAVPQPSQAPSASKPCIARLENFDLSRRLHAEAVGIPVGEDFVAVRENLDRQWQKTVYTNISLGQERTATTGKRNDLRP
jgi:hypothetical protein